MISSRRWINSPRTIGVCWNPVRDGRLGDWDYQIVFSVEGPPFFELIQGPPGSPWDATEGPHFHHLGFWSENLDADRAHLVEQGADVDFDACPHGRAFVYHHLPAVGGRVELVDIALQDGFRETWNVAARMKMFQRPI